MSDLNSLIERNVDFIDSIFNTTTSSWQTNTSHQMEVRDDDFKLYLSAIGLEKDDIDINIKDAVLSIKSNIDLKNKPSIVKNLNFNRRVSTKYDLDNISATLENGLLTVTFKKKEDLNNSKSVTIK